MVKENVFGGEDNLKDWLNKYEYFFYDCLFY